MNERHLGAVLDHETVTRRAEAGDLPGWAIAHFENFRDSMLGTRNGAPFPCFFGVESMREGRPLYTFVPSLSDREALLGLRDALSEFLSVYEEHGDRVSFAAFFRPAGRELSEAEWHGALWHVLQFLHLHDPEPWPEGIPMDPDEEYWEFCFGGEPIFPTARAPFYERRRSRYCALGLEVTFQPRTIFEGITGDTQSGQQAREVIHERLEAYDAAGPHPALGNWGEDHEWPQYLLAEDDSQAPETCPFTPVRRATPLADD